MQKKLESCSFYIAQFALLICLLQNTSAIVTNEPKSLKSSQLHWKYSSNLLLCKICSFIISGTACSWLLIYTEKMRLVKIDKI